MKKKLAVVLSALLIVAIPLAALADVMYVNTSNGGSVNLREGPSADSTILISVPYGEAVDVIELLMGSSWVNVNYNGYFGYIDIRYLSDYPPSPDPWPTFIPGPVPAPTARPNPSPTRQPSGSSSLEKTLAQMYTGFRQAAYDATVVPSTPTNYVNLRWAPSKSAPVRAQYWSGATLHVLNDNGTWAEVYDASNGTYGYMVVDFLRPAYFGTGAGTDSGS